MTDTRVPEVYRYATKRGSEDEWNAKGELGGLLESLDAVNRGCRAVMPIHNQS